MTDIKGVNNVKIGLFCGIGPFWVKNIIGVGWKFPFLRPRGTRLGGHVTPGIVLLNVAK